MKSIISILTLVVLIVSANASEQKKFKITLAGWVNNAEHIEVTPKTKLSEVIAKAGGISVFGVKYRFFRVRIIDLNTTERAENLSSEPNQQEIKKFVIEKDSDPTISELNIIAGDILVFGRKHVYGR